MTVSWLPMLIVALALLAALIYGALRLLLPVLRQHRAGGGGWGALAAVYATAAPVPEDSLPHQTVQVGQTLYKRCVQVGLTAQGLHLALTGIGRLFHREVLLIPWADIHGLREVRLFWCTAWLLSVGTPEIGTITLPEVLIDPARPWLTRHLAAPSGA